MDNIWSNSIAFIADTSGPVKDSKKSQGNKN